MIHPLTLGYDSLMMGGVLNLESFVSYFTLTDATTGLNNASNWAGQLIASITVVQYLNDKFGRRIAVTMGIGCLTIGVILQSAAQNSAMFIVGRFIIGFGGGLTNVSAVVLLAELCPINLRGLFMGMAFTSFLIGSLIASGITYGVRNAPGNWNWRIPSIIQIVPSLVSLVNLLFIPESPKFLLNNGYDREVYETLLIIHKNDTSLADNALEEYRFEEEKIKMEDFRPWRQFFKSRINAHRAVINFTHAILTEMAGSSVGTYYLAILLEQAGISSSDQRLQVNIVMSAWQLVVACTGCFMFDKIGRKRQAMISLSGMIICFFVLGGMVKVFGDGHNKSGSFGSIVFMFLFSGFYSFTYTPLTSLYGPELYPFKMRGAGQTLFQAFNSSWGLISSFVLPFAMNGIGWRFYIVNASYDIIFLPIIYYVWVETRGLDIEKIDEVFWEHPLNRKHMPVTIDLADASVESIDVNISAKV